jgi:hypothetical protein
MAHATWRSFGHRVHLAEMAARSLYEQSIARCRHSHIHSKLDISIRSHGPTAGYGLGMALPRPARALPWVALPARRLRRSRVRARLSRHPGAIISSASAPNDWSGRNGNVQAHRSWTSGTRGRWQQAGTDSTHTRHGHLTLASDRAHASHQHEKQPLTALRLGAAGSWRCRILALPDLGLAHSRRGPGKTRHPRKATKEDPPPWRRA